MYFRKSGKNYGWASGGASILSEFGTLHMEWWYLTQISGNPIYYDKVSSLSVSASTCLTFLNHKPNLCFKKIWFDETLKIFYSHRSELIGIIELVDSKLYS